MPHERPLRVLTWHVHGNYLYYLTQAPHQFFVVTDAHRTPGYGGLGGALPWGSNVHEVALERLRNESFDVVLYQTRRNYDVDRLVQLSDAQRLLPAIFLEHDPPQQHPTNTQHFVDDPAVLLVHVTHFNALMWDSGRTPTRVIEHGVRLPHPAHYDGGLARGIVVVNHLARRGRRLGADVFARARDQVPLDLIGMDAVALGGLGEIPNDALAAFVARYRFFFNPIRYTSLGLAVIEAMMTGVPVVALATTEMATVIDDGRTGYVGTDVDELIVRMQRLIDDPGLARRLGAAGRDYAHARFGIERFARDWDETLRSVSG